MLNLVDENEQSSTSHWTVLKTSSLKCSDAAQCLVMTSMRQGGRGGGVPGRFRKEGIKNTHR